MNLVDYRLHVDAASEGPRARGRLDAGAAM